MIYTKTNFHLRYEDSHAPEWARKEHAEEVRVRPEFAMSMGQIMKRFTQGNVPEHHDNGTADLDTDTQSLTAEHTSALYNQFDPMGANITDMNDYVNLEESFASAVERSRAASQSMVKGPVSEKGSESVKETELNSSHRNSLLYRCGLTASLCC